MSILIGVSGSAVTMMVKLCVLCALWLSVAVNVMVCVPTLSVSICSSAPVPIAPSRLDDHCRLIVGQRAVFEIVGLGFERDRLADHVGRAADRINRENLRRFLRNARRCHRSHRSRC